MKSISLAVLVAATGFLLFATGSALTQTTYSLKAVESNPIPKAAHFQLWKEIALKACAESKVRFNLSESECRTVISQRADTCASQLTIQSPVLISTTAVARDIGRKYMQCATPFYFCNGVEVKTEEEVRARCK